MAPPSSAPKDYHLWHPFTQMETFFSSQRIVIQRGEGPYLFDIHDKQYLNMTSCLWNTHYGLGKREIIDAISEQLKTLGYSTLFRASHTPGIELAGLIADISPGKLNRVFLTSNGSESNESAIKMVRQYFHNKNSKKYKILSLKNSYHGVSYGALAASGFEDDKQGFGPMPLGFTQISPPYCYRCDFQLEYPDCQVKCATALEEAILRENPDEVAMFLVEPVMGFGGVIVPPKEYFQIVAGICAKYDVILMLDEVTTGMGRTGKMFAAEHWGVQPDLMSLGKGLSAGYFPLGATVATDEIWREFMAPDNSRLFNHGSTNAGHPGACAAGLATIRCMTEENMVQAAHDKGESFFGYLKELLEFPIVGDVRGIGMMFALELVQDKATKTPLTGRQMTKVVEACFASGIWVHVAGNKIMLLPPFIMDNELLKKAYDRLRKVMKLATRWV